MQRLAYLIIGPLVVAAFAAAVADRPRHDPHLGARCSQTGHRRNPKSAQFKLAQEGLPAPARRVVLRTIESRMAPSLGGRGLFSAAARTMACKRACRGQHDRDFWRFGVASLQSLQTAQVRIQT